MMNRCAFGCGGSGDLREAGLAKRSVCKGVSRLTSVWARNVLFTATNALWVNLPQRLHRVCVLLWRLPKDEVPFAIGRSVAALFGLARAFGTHSSWARISAASGQL